MHVMLRNTILHNTMEWAIDCQGTVSRETVTDKQVVSARCLTTRRKQRKRERTRQLELDRNQPVG